MSSKNSINNIAFIDSYHKGLYGAPRSMLDLASGLRNKSYNIDIITTKNDLLAKSAIDRKLKVKIFNVPKVLLVSRRSLNFWHKLIYFISLMYTWLKSITLYSLKKYDVICINDIRTFLLFLPILVLNKKKIIWYVRINDRVKIITKIATLLSNKIILISQDCKLLFTDKELHTYNNKIRILHTGFKIPTLEEASIKMIKKRHQDNDKIFISVGSICQRKNQKSLVQCFKNIKITNKHLYILGSPATEVDDIYYNELLNLIESLELTRRITIIPHTHLVFEYLSFSDIFLLASYKEGLPRVAIEALIAGCYVVSSNVDGISDIITNEKIGLVTDEKASEKNFNTAYTKLINDACLRNYNRNYSLTYAKKNFSYDLFIEKFIEILSEHEKN